MKESTDGFIKSIQKAKGDKDITSLLEKVSIMLKNEPDKIVLLQARAELYKKLQKFGLAINDYQTILSLDKTNQQAQVQTEQLLTILKYQNTDIFESPNTNFDPWLD